MLEKVFGMDKDGEYYIETNLEKVKEKENCNDNSENNID